MKEKILSFQLEASHKLGNTAVELVRNHFGKELSATGEALAQAEKKAADAEESRNTLAVEFAKLVDFF